MRRRFFVQGFAAGKATLEGEAARHLGRVLRAEPGQLYELSDGTQANLGRIESVGKDSIEFAIVQPIPVRTASLEIVLLLAVVKFDRFEWALEKATELGAVAIMPLAAARSERVLLAAAPKRVARWRKILFGSAQQARRLRPPSLEPLTAPAEAFGAFARSATARILLSERPGAPSLRHALEALAPAGAASNALVGPTAKVALAVGPEGGWTDAEFAAAEAAGFREAALAENILRTETAVIAALAGVQLFFG